MVKKTVFTLALFAVFTHAPRSRAGGEIEGLMPVQQLAGLIGFSTLTGAGMALVERLRETELGIQKYAAIDNAECFARGILIRGGLAIVMPELIALGAGNFESLGQSPLQRSTIANRCLLAWFTACGYAGTRTMMTGYDLLRAAAGR